MGADHDHDHDLLMIIRRIMIRFMGIFAFPFEDSPSNTLFPGKVIKLRKVDDRIIQVQPL